MNKKIILLISILTACFFLVQSSDGFARRNGVDNSPSLKKSTNAVRYLQNIGNLWTVVSNYGWIGDDAFNNPSFESPGGSGNHYLYQGSIWIGAKDPGGVIRVTAGDEEEFTQTTDPADTVKHWTKFNVLSDAEKAMGKKRIISDNDTWAEYTDLDPQYHNTGEGPLGLKVIEQTYGWSAGYNDDFLIFDYQIINIGLKNITSSGLPDPNDPGTQRTLTDVYVAMRFDFDVSYLGSGEYWYDDLTEYDAARKISFGYDGDDPDFPGNDIGENGTCTGYIYARLLNSPQTDPNLSGAQLEDTPVSH
ncbi:hypothetical protein JW960_10670, partial [candidate division KSB1 bacterium]|nr:hypothetical protein [candidate division KSB1 bacterium]